METSLAKFEPVDYPTKEFLKDFERIVRGCMKNDRSWGLLQNDLLFAATYWLMVECGFEPTPEVERKKKKNMRVTSLPESWKHGTKQLYEAQFILPPYKEHTVRLVALPVGDILCMNLSVANLSPRIFNLKSLAVSSSGFVPRPEAKQVFSKFSDIHYFRFYMRTSLIWPIRCSILTDQGIINGSLLGLSDEMKLKIMSFLDVKDALSFGSTCHDLNRISNDQLYWKMIFHRDFKSHCRCAGPTPDDCGQMHLCWKENYKSCYYKWKFANRAIGRQITEPYRHPLIRPR